MIVAASFFEVFSKDLSLHESITDDGNLSRFQVILLSYLMISKAEDKLYVLQRKWDIVNHKFDFAKHHILQLRLDMDEPNL